MTETVWPARAKVNLYLHVVGRRADGYHLLDSLAVFPDIGDSLTVRPAADLTLALAGPAAAALAAEPDNLVLRAARALAATAGIAPGAALSLCKRLPVASGIGGGSADAAAALNALTALWGLARSEADLAALGLGLGADVPVCLRSRPTQMAGIGEILTPAPALPPGWMLLVNPGIAVATPPVFKARSGPFSPAAPLTAAPADAPALAAALRARRNDLAEAAISLAPPIATVLAALDAQPGCLLARMSGSGATCFGLFAREAEARAACRALRRAEPGWWTKAGAF
ncbi:4-diphosphocytidyl-2-C-methyl-D-erythritol kinase [mine drainage metagenome]|uniref:4-(cytidine 5'-diphospho)-2-C-methyl-D-erythritol kinase n=1 Tax=mine drainage metagenome TaxID=410659 RepID=A0A1J5SGJ4_9ZZZZ